MQLKNEANRYVDSLSLNLFESPATVVTVSDSAEFNRHFKGLRSGPETVCEMTYSIQTEQQELHCSLRDTPFNRQDLVLHCQPVLSGKLCGTVSNVTFH